MKFLDGFKTIIGMVGSLAVVLSPSIAPDLVDKVGTHVVGIAEGAFGLLAALGLIHKAEKAKAKKG